MSSPIPIPFAYPSPSDEDASPTSPGLYVPVHRRGRTSGYASSSELSSSPSSSTRSFSPSPLPTPGIYTPAQLLALSHSPLIVQMGAIHVEALRAVAPEVVQTRKQRKALAWRSHQATATATSTPAHRRTSSRSRQSESEEDRAVSWRRP